MITVKKLSELIAVGALSASCLGLEAAPVKAHHPSSFPVSETNHGPGSRNPLIVPPDAPDRPAVYYNNDMYIVLASNRETGGQFSLFDFFAPPAGGPALHLHYREAESFFVLEGEITVLMENQTYIARPGDYVYLPLRRFHGFSNQGTTRARTLALTTPGGLDEFFALTATPVVERSLPPPPVTEEDIARILEIGRRVGQGRRLALGEPVPIAADRAPFRIVRASAPSRESFSIGGGTYTSLATYEESEGAISLFNALLPPQATSGPLPIDSRDKALYVLEGDLTLQLDNQTRVLSAGSFAYFPNGKGYAFQNLGSTPVRTLVLTTSPRSVPEPSSGLGILGFGACFGASWILKRKQQKPICELPHL